MRRRASAVSVLVLACACACSCSKEHAAVQAAASASGPTPSSAASVQRLLAGSVPHVMQTKPACRALLVTGKASVEGTPVVLGSLLDGEHWVDLEAGSSVSLRHTLTSREFKLIGPARVLPCRHGAEQVLLARGQLTTSANLGVRPGAEVLIATPAGTIHYGDAALDAEFGPKGLRLRVKEGEAWMEPETQGLPPFKNPIHGNALAALPPSKLDAAGLGQACQVAAEKAQESAQRVLGAGADPGTLGARAAAQVRDRSAARSACAMAAAALGLVADPAERQSLSASIAHSDELWQSVPHAISAQKN